MAKHFNNAEPLAARMRPKALSEFIGQEHLLNPNAPITAALEQGVLHSMIFWGPTGTGKTSLARLIAHFSNAHFETISAVFSGVKDIRAVVERAKQLKKDKQQITVLFVDEVHRFNKGQQDAFLPFVEDGTLVFIAATTENPSFELNNALLSRAKVYVLKALSEQNIMDVLKRALADSEHGLGREKLVCAEEQLKMIALAADGDARTALNLLELAAELAKTDKTNIISEVVVKSLLVDSTRRFDKFGESFYDQISALHKTIRGSDPDAALYWLCRMLDGGCDPLYIARRLVRTASEDIGNADPRALSLTLSAWDVIERLGSPEAELTLAQTVIYLSCAPKSNAVYKAFQSASKDAVRYGSLDVPLHLRNAPTSLMRDLDYGKNYRYAHNEPNAYAAAECYFPDGMPKRNYYQPSDRGLERKIGEKLTYLAELDQKALQGEEP